MNSNYIIVCNSCNKKIKSEEIKLLTEIVSTIGKNVTYGDGSELRIVAVKYYFECPRCGTKYVCFFKDKVVNQLFDQDNLEAAAERMKMLWEIFTNV